MAEIVRFADKAYGNIEANNMVARRALALDAFAASFGLKHFPMLTRDNSRETEKGFIIVVGDDAWIGEDA